MVMSGTDHEGFTRFEKAGWADPEIARHYAEEFARASEAAVPHLVTMSGALPGSRALDLCCGHGIVAEGLAAAGAEVTALDFSPAMLEMAGQRVPEATLVAGDASDTGLEGGVWDCVTVGFGILHVPDPAALLAEARRLLKPGGRLAFSTWLGPDVPSAVAWVFGAMARHGAKDIQLPPGPGPFDFAGQAAAEAGLVAAGFRPVGSAIGAGEWQIDVPDRPVDYFASGTVRGAALLKGQPPANMAAIREAVSEKVITHCGGAAPYRVPAPSVIWAGEAV